MIISGQENHFNHPDGELRLVSQQAHTIMILLTAINFLHDFTKVNLESWNFNSVDSNTKLARALETETQHSQMKSDLKIVQCGTNAAVFQAFGCAV